MITEGELNNLGEAGWRLASVVDTDDGANGIFYRSRQAEEDTQIGHAPAVEEKPSKKEMWLR
jgi:hypothetical protein